MAEEKKEDKKYTPEFTELFGPDAFVQEEKKALPTRRRPRMTKEQREKAAAEKAAKELSQKVEQVQSDYNKMMKEVAASREPPTEMQEALAAAQKRREAEDYAEMIKSQKGKKLQEMIDLQRRGSALEYVSPAYYLAGLAQRQMAKRLPGLTEYAVSSTPGGAARLSDQGKPIAQALTGMLGGP
jgi:Tfp pilus assembly protein FimV